MNFNIECIDEEEDEEFLKVLSKSLTKFLDLIGGPDYVLKIIKIFDNIIVQDDYTVKKEVKL